MCDIEQLDEAIYQTAHNYKDPDTGKKGGKALGKALGTNPGTFEQKISRNVETHTVNIKEARSMMKIAQDFRILHAFAMDLGHACFRLPTSEYPADMDLLNAWADWNEEISETVQEIRNALKSDKITKSHVAEVKRELIEDLGKGLSLWAVLEAMAEDE